MLDLFGFLIILCLSTIYSDVCDSISSMIGVTLYKGYDNGDCSLVFIYHPLTGTATNTESLEDTLNSVSYLMTSFSCRKSLNTNKERINVLLT